MPTRNQRHRVARECLSEGNFAKDRRDSHRVPRLRVLRTFWPIRKVLGACQISSTETLYNDALVLVVNYYWWAWKAE